MGVSFSSEGQQHAADSKPKNLKKICKFIITVGPTGSGKGSIRNLFLPLVCDKLINSDCNDTNCKQHFKIFDANVDEIVVNNNKYKDEMGKFYEADDIKTKVNDFVYKNRTDTKALDDLSDKMSKLYYKVRSEIDADNENDANLHKYMRQGYHIILESTMTSPNPPYWICDFINEINKELTQYFYEPVIIFPFVEANLLADRILNRFKNDFKNYQKNKELNAAPRLPTTKQDVISNSVKAVQHNIKSIIDDSKCFNKFVIYDNNTKPAHMVFYLDLEKEGYHQTEMGNISLTHELIEAFYKKEKEVNEKHKAAIGGGKEKQKKTVKKKSDSRKKKDAKKKDTKQKKSGDKSKK